MRTVFFIPTAGSLVEPIGLTEVDGKRLLLLLLLVVVEVLVVVVVVVVGCGTLRSVCKGSCRARVGICQPLPIIRCFSMMPAVISMSKTACCITRMPSINMLK